MSSEYDLSVLIPARQEEFLKHTIENVLKNKRAKTQIIVGLDGYWPDPPIIDNKDVVIIHYSEPIGQRAMTKQLARLAKSPYIMKLDAHCTWDEGHDLKMLEAFKKTGDDVTMVGVMRNLWMFDWKCYDCGRRTYQGPTPDKCDNCGGTNLKKKMVMIGKDNPQSTSYCFDSEPHFQYFKEYTKRPEYIEAKAKDGITESMSLQGSCFMMTKKRYFDLDMDDEEFGTWGSQGLTIAIKTWQSGGRVLVNHSTWYAHLFRTSGGDFGFPYTPPNSNPAKRHAKKIFFNKKLVWLIEKFNPPGWTEEDLQNLKK